jgi:hypothetical protein
MGESGTSGMEPSLNLHEKAEYKPCHREKSRRISGRRDRAQPTHRGAQKAAAQGLDGRACKPTALASFHCRLSKVRKMSG